MSLRAMLIAAEDDLAAFAVQAPRPRGGLFMKASFAA